MYSPRVKRKDRYDIYFRSEFRDEPELGQVRYRALRSVDKDRWEYLGLEFKKGYYFAVIYTPEQADILGIQYRTNWREPHPSAEKRYLSQHVFQQRDDWVITEYPDSNGQYWVMQVLWRNHNPTFEYMRTATGSYAYHKKKPFNGEDMAVQYKSSNIDEKLNGRLTAREKLMCFWIARHIVDFGIFNSYIVGMAYRTAYGNRVRPGYVKEIMESHKIMSQVAKELKKILGNKGADLSFIVDQLMDMAKKDYDRDPQRRERVNRLLLALHGAPAYADFEQRAVALSKGVNSPVPIEDAEVLDDLDQIKKLEAPDNKNG